jgi:hypothetical protein
MDRSVTYVDYLFKSKDRVKEELEERLNKLQDILQKIEKKYNDNTLIKDSTLIYLKETLILALSYLALCNSNKVDEYKNFILDKLAYIRKNRLLTLAQYRETCNQLRQILAI